MLSECPFDSNHQDTARIIQFQNGALSFGCFHNGCQARKWADLCKKCPPDYLAVPTAQKREPQVAQAIALLGDIELFQTPEREAWARINKGGFIETIRVEDSDFRKYIVRRFYKEKNASITTEAATTVATVLAGDALQDGEVHSVSTRIAGNDHEIYIDLCNQRREVVKVTSAGWTIEASSVMPFRRSYGMLPLPTPVRGGRFDELREYGNLRDDATWGQLAGYLISAFRPTGPYGIAHVTGAQGSGKTTLIEIIRALVDPNKAPVRTAPRNERDLVITAVNSWLLGFDNLSRIPDWLSDGLCRLSTGGGYATRALYKNGEETIFEAQRPIAVAGIEDLAERGDLADRCVFIELPTIAKQDRKPMSALRDKFRQAKPRLFGAILDALVHTIREFPRTTLADPPRMADMAQWIAASEKNRRVSVPFMQAYSASRTSASSVVVESTPITKPLLALLEKQPAHSWSGSASSLLSLLDATVSDATKRKQKWPKAPNVLSGALRRLAPDLESIGVTVGFVRKNNARELVLARVSSPPSQSSPPVLAAQAASACNHPGAAHGDSGDDLEGGVSAEEWEVPEYLAVPPLAVEEQAELQQWEVVYGRCS